jgi:hypothetical protein
MSDARLFGLPVEFTDRKPPLGKGGDIILVNPAEYPERKLRQLLGQAVALLASLTAIECIEEGETGAYCLFCKADALWSGAGWSCQHKNGCAYQAAFGFLVDLERMTKG